jgi:argininosuccinate lyase
MATDLADYLVDRGVPFREAHRVVGALVRRSEQLGVELNELPLAEIRASHAAYGADVLEALSPEASVSRRTVPGSTGTDAVAAQIAAARAIAN